MATGKGRIGVPELLVGVPFPSLALEIVRFALPASVIGEVIYRGKSYTAEDARNRGFVDEICEANDLLERAEVRARALAALPQEVVWNHEGSTPTSSSGVCRKTRIGD